MGAKKAGAHSYSNFALSDFLRQGLWLNLFEHKESCASLHDGSTDKTQPHRQKSILYLFNANPIKLLSHP